MWIKAKDKLDLFTGEDNVYYLSIFSHCDIPLLAINKSLYDLMSYLKLSKKQVVSIEDLTTLIKEALPSDNLSNIQSDLIELLENLDQLGFIELMKDSSAFEKKKIPGTESLTLSEFPKVLEEISIDDISQEEDASAYAFSFY